MKAQLLSLPKVQLLKQQIKQQNNVQFENESQNMEHVKQTYETIIEFGWNLSQQFKTSHIGNAMYMDSAELEYPPYWLLKPEQQIYNVINRYVKKSVNQSINPCVNAVLTQRQSNVLVYNRHVEGMSIIPACRLALILLQYNIVQTVDILVGGYEAYMNQQTSTVNIIRISYTTTIGSPKVIIGLEELQQMINNGSQLIDIRTKPQYDGIVSGYDYFHLKGRITGAIYHGGMQSKGSCQVKQYSVNGQFKTMWKTQNIDINRHIILYCGSGWRVSQAMVYAVLNGITNISIYSNGWFQWSIQNIASIQQNHINSIVQLYPENKQQMPKTQLKIVGKCCRKNV